MHKGVLEAVPTVPLRWANPPNLIVEQSQEGYGMRYLRMQRSLRVKRRPQRQFDPVRGAQPQPVPDPESASQPSHRKTGENNAR